MVMQAKGGSEAPLSVRSPGREEGVEDVYFSVDIESDGPIPGPYSMLSFAMTQAGVLRDGRFSRSAPNAASFYVELKPISDLFDAEALAINGLNREALVEEGMDAAPAMAAASDFVQTHAAGGAPIMVAYPLGFDWSFMYWYFVRFTGACPFRHSRAFDLKTAIAVKTKRAIARSGHKHLPSFLQTDRPHTHNALDDARAQAEVFARLMEWEHT